LTGATQLGHI